MKSIVQIIYLVFFQSKYTSVYFLSQISFKDMGTPINDIYMYIYEHMGGRDSLVVRAPDS